MSHIAEIELQIKDLQALKEAAKALGLELREGQETYRWYGRSVGDYPLPAGFTKEDLGKCEHALSIPGSPYAYEIGVVARKDGKPGYTLLWDFWQGGYGLEEKVGRNAIDLQREYAFAVSKAAARKKGFTKFKVITTQEGHQALRCRK